MNKLLVTMLLLSAAMTICAQGRWETINREADPMKGVTAKIVCVYTDESVGTFYVWDWDKPIFRLITNSGMFRPVKIMGSEIIPVRVGFYNEDGTLDDMFDFYMCPVDNRMNKDISTDSYYVKGRKKIREIMSRLKKGKGFVRFLVERQYMPDFDLKVMPYNP